ncbi:MAG TPA: hypothetical protein VIG85_06550 [Comamonas sp.]
MLITLTRDSVAPGDDMQAPHRLQLPLADGMTLLELLHPYGPLSDYLPAVEGMSTLWVVQLNGHHVADLRHCHKLDPMLQTTLRAADLSLSDGEVFLQAIGQQALA